MSAPEIAVAYVSIVPEIQGFARKLREQIVGPAEDAGAEAGSSLKDKLKAGAAAAGIAAGAVLAKGLVDAFEQAGITSKLQAQLGATGKDAKRYGDVAGKLYTKGVTENFQQGADAIRSVVQAGLAPPDATNKQLQSIAAKAVDVSTVFDQDLGGVTNAVAQMMKTGLAKNSTEAFDIITRGFQTGANKADDLVDTINEYGTQFRKAGLDGSTAVGLINQAIRAGARDSDIAADAIKEFSILAVNGSKTTQDGFKALGLNADEMAAKFSRGGKSASGALDTTLDRLRNMKDPVERSATAVNLFGTQAEDLGDALFAMDPSKAADGLGKVGGAASKVGKTIHSGPKHEIEVFTRTLQQGLVNVLGKYVIPAIGDTIDVFRDIAGAAVGAWKWVKDVSPLLAPLAIAIGGVTLALNAQAIATGLVTGVFAIYRGAILVGTAVTNGMAAAQALLNAVMSLNPFVLVAIALAALVAGIVVAYKRSETFRAIVTAAWQGIQKAAQFAWNNVLKPVLRALASTVQWLYRSAIKPVFGLIVGVFQSWWSNAKMYAKLVQGAFHAVASVAKWLYNNGIRPAFNWIADKASWLWNRGVKPSFDALKRGVSAVGRAFNTAKDYIGRQWSKLAGIAKKPVSFIVNTVYNKGVVGMWNKVAGAFGAPKLNTWKFATGGILPGYTPGRDVHLAALSGGEAVMRPEWTRAMGPGYVNTMNAAARKGGVGGVRKLAGSGQLPAFKDGGIFNWIGNKLQGAGSAAWEGIKKGASWLKDGLESSARAGVKHVVDPLLKRIPGSSTAYGKAIRGVPNKIVDSIFGYAKTADKKMEAAGIGGKGSVSALRWARTQNGKPYQWGGNGNPSWDCSGFMSAIESVIRGQRPHRRWATGSFSGNQAPSGWVRGMKAPFMIGITNAGVGHTAGTLNGVNVESRGGSGVLVGSRARSYRDSLFTDVYGFAPSRKFDNGGWLQPGATMAVNKTGRPEPILTASQWSSMATLAAQGGNGLKAGDRLVLSVDGRTQLEAYVDSRADGRIEKGLVSPASLGRTR